MGRPYLQELQELRSTYASAFHAEAAAEVVAFLKTAPTRPLFLVGSGGAFSAARYMASVIEHVTGHPTRVFTPLELLSTPTLLRNARLVIVSASGGNKDIVAVAKVALASQGTHVLTFCASARAKIRALCAGNSRAWSATVPLGGAKDGFLAVNSVLSFAVVFSQACRIAFESDLTLPDTYDDLIREIPKDLIGEVVREAAEKRDFLVILHGAPALAAAVDLESKSTEAGMIACLVSDLRNFAHGRHHWLAKRGKESAVLCLSGPSEKKLANKTLSYIPKEIPRIHYSAPGNFVTSAIRALIATFYAAWQIGAARGIDPGRPGVPSFGSKIYSLGPSLLQTENRLDSSPVERAVQRKLSALGLGKGAVHSLAARAEEFVASLQTKRFKGVVVDYDGTLVSTRDRLALLDKGLAAHLNRILGFGMKLAVCTGRGKSVLEPLCVAIEPRHHSSVLVSLYNGTATTTLRDGEDGVESRVSREQLEEQARLFEGIRPALTQELSEVVDVSVAVRPTQVTVTSNSLPVSTLWHLVSSLLIRERAIHLRAVHSSHSVDIIHRDTSKLNALEQVRHRFEMNADDDMLLFGDMGRWPGNDAELLSAPTALSVDETALYANAGWNFAPYGATGPDALLYYLEGLTKSKAGEGRWLLPGQLER